MRRFSNKALFLAASALVAAPRTFEGENAFAFPDTVDDINAVPERARGLYEQEDGKGPFKFKDVGGLRNSLTNARAERDSAKRDAAQAAEWKKLGKTPEEIQTLLNEQSEREQQRLTEEGDWAALRTQMETNHTAALGEKDKRINKLQTSLETTLIDNGLMGVLGDAEVEGDPLLLLPHMRGRVKLEEHDDGFKTVVLREDGSPMLNGSNQPATLKDLALQFKGDSRFGSAFKGLNNSGGGAQGGQGGGGGGGGTGGAKKRSDMTTFEKVSFIKEHGRDKYEALPA